MRKLALVLLLAAMPAWADWSPAAEGESVYVYADKTTIRKRGNIVKLWTMYDLRKPDKLYDGREYLSFIMQDEYNCAEEQGRTLAATYYSENFGAGTSLKSTNTPNSVWAPVVPRSIGMAIFDVACGKQ